MVAWLIGIGAGLGVLLFVLRLFYSMGTLAQESDADILVAFIIAGAIWLLI